MGPPISVLEESSVLEDNSSQPATQPLNYSQDSEMDDQSISQEDKVFTSYYYWWHWYFRGPYILGD